MMNRSLLLFLVAMTACLCFAYGCKDDSEDAPDSVYMYSTSGSVDAAAGMQSVTVFTTCAWQATGDDWITIDPASADTKGIHVVHLSFSSNETGTPRVGRIVFKAGSYSETYTLTQTAE